MSLKNNTEHFEESTSDMALRFLQYMGIIIVILVALFGSYKLGKGICEMSANKYY